MFSPKSQKKMRPLKRERILYVGVTNWRNHPRERNTAIFYNTMGCCQAFSTKNPNRFRQVFTKMLLNSVVFCFVGF